MEKKTFIVVNFTELPEEVKDEIQDWCGFSNDCMIEARSELDGNYSMDEVESWHKDYPNEEDGTEDIEDFKAKVLSKFDLYMIENILDPQSEVIVDICW